MTSKVQIKNELEQILAEIETRVKYNKFENYYFQDHLIDENGLDISRKNYPAHMAFMRATANYRELAFIAPNRAGKSDCGSYLIAAIATGRYPEWWEGKRFKSGTQLEILVIGKTNLAVRDVAQKKLFGPMNDPGSGMIPRELVVSHNRKPGIPDSIQDLYIKNIDGTTAHIQFLSQEIDDDVIMGRELHAIWFDEECLKMKLYNEALMRTMTTNGIVFTTFTPLDGVTEGIMRFMPNMTFPIDGDVKDDMGKSTGRFVVNCGWDSAPHLSEKMKVDMAARYTGAELIARTKGIPTIGSGHIYPIPEEDILVKPFQIPAWWPKSFGMDVGWNRTACIWGAIDPDTKITYLYSEHYMGKEMPAAHAVAIKARGKWIVGAIDPRADSRNVVDGSRLIDIYENEDLRLIPADNSVEAGLLKVRQLLEAGLLKVFNNLNNWRNEYRIYRKDDNGKIVKQNDHLMDAMRYLIMTGMDYAIVEPDPDEISNSIFYENDGNTDAVTGY